MRSRVRSFGVFTLSAIDLFASAMGAFIIITIILMPDYQKEVRLEGHLAALEAMAQQSETLLDETEAGSREAQLSLSAALAQYRQLQAEQAIISSELETEKARLQASRQKAPPPRPSPVDTEEEISSHQVTFRFLGLKTDRTRLLMLVDLNKYLAEHQSLVASTVTRALDSLDEGYEFAILGFQQLDSGARYMRWPEQGGLAVMTPANRGQAYRFVHRMSSESAGSSSLTEAFEQAFATPADAIILFSDGLPNPAFNRGLPPGALVQEITLANHRSVEIHTVTIGDYFKYKTTVEFMESLARANAGGFMALAQ